MRNCAYVILGAYGGVGSALARRLAANGAKLTLVGRDEVKLAALADELSAHRLVADATQSSEVEAVVAAAATEHGELSGVANCFGSLLLKPAHLTSDAELEQTLAIHVKSSFAALRTTPSQPGSVPAPESLPTPSPRPPAVARARTRTQ